MIHRSSEVRIDWRVIAAVTAALIALFTFQNYVTPVLQRGGQSLGRTIVLQIIVWGAWLIVSPLIFAAARAWWRGPGLTPVTAATQLVISFGISLLQAALGGAIRWLTGVSTYDALGDVFFASITANLGSNILRYWLIAAAYHAVAYQHELRIRDVRAARVEGALVQAKLDSLQGRLHPHFLFNTLNSIAALIREQPAAAEQMIGSLSELLRASLTTEPSREVTLDCELDLIRQYVSIQQRRFHDRLTVSTTAEPETLAACVPHLVLQPVVENAIIHGIAPREEPGHVRITADRVGESLRLVVEDDGVGFRPGSDAGFGLNGTRARLQHLYGPGARLDIASARPTGAIVTITLPYHTTTVTVSEASA